MDFNGDGVLVICHCKLCDRSTLSISFTMDRCTTNAIKKGKTQLHSKGLVFTCRGVWKTFVMDTRLVWIVMSNAIYRCCRSSSSTTLHYKGAEGNNFWDLFFLQTLILIWISGKKNMLRLK